MSNDKSFHQELLQQMLERIEVAYLKAKEHQLVDPIVVLFDLADPLSAQINERMGRGQDSVAMIAEANRRGVRAVATWHIPGDFGAELFTEAGHLNVANLIRDGSSHPKVFLVVIVAGGMLSVVACPVPAR